MTKYIKLHWTTIRWIVRISIQYVSNEKSTQHIYLSCEHYEAHILLRNEPIQSDNFRPFLMFPYPGSQFLTVLTILRHIVLVQGSGSGKNAKPCINRARVISWMQSRRSVSPAYVYTQLYLYKIYVYYTVKLRIALWRSTKSTYILGHLLSKAYFRTYNVHILKIS